MKLAELHQLAWNERYLAYPQELPESFYETANDDLAELREMLEDAPDPSSIEQQLEAYETELFKLYQLRFVKIEQAAKTVVMSHFGDPEYLTPEEQRLFEEIKDTITANHERIFDDLPVDLLALQ